jgi:DNA-binding Lrp family transcriptional regulator
MEACEVQVIEDPEKVKLLVNETRQAIIYSLAQNAMSLSQLARKLNKTPATIHFHVKKLEHAGFVKLEKTKIVNNNLIEKYYVLAVSPCIVGLGVNIHSRGPVPPRVYRQMKTKLTPFLQQLMMQYTMKIGKKERKLIKDMEEIINEIISENDVTFREMMAQLNLKLSLRDKARIQRAVNAVPVFTFCQLLCKPERLALLNKFIQQMLRSVSSHH